VEYDICCEEPLQCLNVYYSAGTDVIFTNCFSAGTINNSPFWLVKIKDCPIEIFYNNITKRWETNGLKPACGSLVGESYSYIGLYGRWGNQDGYVFEITKL
jgi:hypothetical protein